MSTRYDVTIVGAGPAGSTLATLLARRGLEVCLLDRRRFPRPKVCGEYMSPQALGILDELGVLDPLLAAGARRLRGLAMRSRGGREFRGDYEPVDGFAPYRSYGLGISRAILDETLLRRAEETHGVTVLEGFNVRGLLHDGDRAAGVWGRSDGTRPASVHSRVVVGADGVRSIVARLAGLARPERRLAKFAFRGYFEGLNDDDRGELHIGDDCYAGIAPVEGGRANVNLIVDLSAIGRVRGNASGFFDAELAKIPGMRERLDGAERIGPVRSTGPMACSAKSPIAAGVCLVGDAARFVDPFTGEGIFMALRSAEVLSEELPRVLERGEATLPALRSYRASWSAEFGRKLVACRNVQRFLYRPAIADFVVGRLAACPSLGRRVLAASGDYLPPGRIVRPSTLLGLLTPLLPFRRPVEEVS